MFELPAFEIVIGPLFKNADPYAEDEVCNDNAKEEYECEEEKVGGHDCSVLFCRLLKGCGCGVKMMEGLHRHIEYYPGQGIYGPGITTHGRGVRGPYPKTSGLLLLLGLITLNILLLQVAGLRSSSLAGLATFRKRRFFRHPLPQLH